MLSTLIYHKSALHFYKLFNFFIPGYIAAQRDLWIHGDKFVNDVFHALQAMKSAAKDAQKPVPYVYDYYNITCITECNLSGSENLLVKLVNAVIKTLNANQLHIPRIITIIPDLDILCFINHFAFGVSQIIGQCLTWLVCNIKQAIDAKKDDLRHRKPGALHSSEPKIIWMKIFQCPGVNYAHLNTVRHKFNCILEDILSTRKNHFIMEVSAKISDPANFFPGTSKLNDYGMELFWLETDRILESFDYDKDKLILQQQKQSHFQQAARPTAHVYLGQSIS